MRHATRFTLILTVACLVVLGRPDSLYGQAAVAKKTVVLVADAWAPYNMVPGSKPEGYILDFAREVFAAKGSAWRYTGHESVNSVTLGVIKAYDYRPWLSAYIAKYQDDPRRVQMVFGDKPLETNIRKIMAGKISAVVDSQTAVLYTARTLGLSAELRLAGVDTEPAYIHIAFSPAKSGSKELAGILANGIRDLRKSGRLAKILEQYGLKDWK